MSRGLSLPRAQQRRLPADAGAWPPAFGFAHTELAAAISCAHDLLRRRPACEQGTGMAHVEVAGHQHLLHRLGQLQQAQQVAGRAARSADRLRGLFVGQPELVDQPLQALRFFQRVEVLALDVLDQRHHGGGFVGHMAHQHRNLVQPGQAAAR
jgi:hypothetical protein